MKTLAHWMTHTVDGRAALEELKANVDFDGDTFDDDAFRHAYRAGRRSVICDILEEIERQRDERESFDTGD